MALTDSTIRQANSAEKPRKLFDGGGLYLLVTPDRGKYWRLKYRFDGKEKSLSFGVYPAVSLTAARGLRDRARALLAEGVDPSEVRKEERAIQHHEATRLEAEMRFSVDSDGALSIQLGSRRMNLNPSETARLRAFLIATREVLPKE
ncbi:Arm DNA-binding domain-containing protein [Paraburkholderia sp. BR10936]|uniref:Arm DNA-binding domain-containing protein n=1 Tax=Paraburkholderia sp. BR10936 TaxID=3236993 RepID=UPI0034D2D717